MCVCVCVGHIHSWFMSACVAWQNFCLKQVMLRLTDCPPAPGPTPPATLPRPVLAPAPPPLPLLPLLTLTLNALKLIRHHFSIAAKSRGAPAEGFDMGSGLEND